MTIFDFVVLTIFVVSILLSVVRGIVRESLSLAGWVIAFMVAKEFDKDFVSVLPLSITGSIASDEHDHHACICFD